MTFAKERDAEWEAALAEISSPLACGSPTGKTPEQWATIISDGIDMLTRPLVQQLDAERAKVAELEAALVATGRLEEQARGERDRAEADAAAMRAALQEIANHGLDLPAACCVTEEYQNGYSRGVVSQGAIARKALREAPNDL